MWAHLESNQGPADYLVGLGAIPGVKIRVSSVTSDTNSDTGCYTTQFGLTDTRRFALKVAKLRHH